MIGRGVYQQSTPRAWRRWAVIASVCFGLGMFLANIHKHSVRASIIGAVIVTVVFASLAGIWIWLQERDAKAR